MRSAAFGRPVPHGTCTHCSMTRPLPCRDLRHGWTYSRLAKLSHAFGGWLAERGVSAGDRVLIQSPNGLELAAMLYGCSRRGAIFVPVNPGMKPFHLRSVFANCQPRITLAGH